MTDINLTGKISAASMSGRLSNLYIPKDVTEYTGPTSITPSTVQQQFDTARKLVNENLVVEGAKLDVLEATENGTYRPSGGAVGFSQVEVNVQPDLKPLEVDSITQSNTTFLPTGDGFSQVTVEEQWDGILYPVTDETDPLYESKVFNAKWVRVYTGDTVIVEGYGRGRILGFRGEKTLTVPTLPNTVNVNVRADPQFDYMRFKFDVTEDCILVVAGYYSSPDGGHSNNTAYIFRGDWVRWKVIHAS